MNENSSTLEKNITLKTLLQSTGGKARILTKILEVLT